jgi:hypothetical protein
MPRRGCGSLGLSIKRVLMDNRECAIGEKGKSPIQSQEDVCEAWERPSADDHSRIRRDEWEDSYAQPSALKCTCSYPGRWMSVLPYLVFPNYP